MLADERLPVLFERGRLESTILGNSTNDHQKEFMEMLGMAALHLTYVPYASDSISSGGLFQRTRDTGPNRAYSFDPADYPLSLFKLKGTKGSISQRCKFGSCLTCLVRGGVCSNAPMALPQPC